MSNTKLNAIALYTNFLVLAVIGIAINPLLVRSLGAEHFGIWKSCLRILDLSSVADGRATQALKWIVAHQETQEGEDQKQRDIGSAIAIWFIWLPFLFCAISISVFALPWLVSGIAESEVTMVRTAAAFLGLNVILTALLGIPDAVLAGTNQGYRSYVLTTSFLVLSNIFIVLAAYGGFGLVALGAVTLIAQIFNGIAVYFVARRHVSWWGIRLPKITDIRRMLGFSNLTLVWSLTQLFMLSTEVLLIGHFSGPIEVSRYTFTSYVSQFALSICLMTGSAVTPRLGSLLGEHNHEGAATLYRQTRAILLFIITIIASGVILVNGIFVALWVGPDFYLGDFANLAIVVAMIQLALIRYDAQVQDVGLKIGTKVVWGGIGAVTSFAIAAVIYAATGNLTLMFVGLLLGRLPLNFIFPRYVGILVPQIRRDVRGVASMALILSGIFLLSKIWRPEGWLGLITLLVVGCSLATFASLFLIFDKRTRTEFRRTLNSGRHLKI